jgi:hypothetical protein
LALFTKCNYGEQDIQHSYGAEEKDHLGEAEADGKILWSLRK